MSPPAPVVLRAEHLGRVADGRALVDDVSFEVRQGDVLAVVGPSGAGKSSLLRLLNRLDEPTAGAVYLDGQDARALPPRELRRRVGMVMQTPALFPGTVAENLSFGPRQRGAALGDGALAALLRQVGLGGFAERGVDRLSGGEARRVAIARAVANEPSVLLMDEPTSALDDVSKREIEALVAEVVRARGLTCVVITHDLAQAARVAGRVLVMEAGRVRRIGPVEEVLRAEGTGS
ncbi:MAG TPA: ATP-binding cassette domain-containing protein [Anaeromyxobacteraceae bacterium]|jgi:putative ABC transport system ATP-binding protein|nr:ATP-binding cassette domain-containing protein [Anaeromyxobacteraceae bacterium]